MKFLRLLTPLLGFAMILAGCASRGPIGPLATPSGPSSSVAIATGALPPPAAGDFREDFRPYQIGSFDKLDIGVFGVEGLELREYRADGAGRISFPLAGTIDAIGMTPGELETEIAQRLRNGYIRDPQVTVNLKDTTSRVVTVGGQVQRPGSYPVVGRMTLVRAVAAAGGLGDFAQTDEVLIFRTVEGRKLAAIYDMRGIERGNYDDPEIYANDVVIVGDSPQKRAIRDLIGAIPAIVAPLLVTVLQ